MLLVLLYFLFSFSGTECYQIHFGECPLFYDEPCNPEIVQFYLSTKRTKLFPLNPLNLSLPKTFTYNDPIKVLIHGYGGLSIDKPIKAVAASYEKHGSNIIIVDWSQLSYTPCYFTSYLNTWHVGQCIALLVISLVASGFPLELVHLVGFSLGAHVAGFSGNYIQHILGVKLKRITGLDPALPFFATPNNDWKLDPSDAAFVDVVHTSAGYFGKIEASGHADFYMNGGYFQPYCYNARYPPFCSHMTVGLYFAESINSNKSFVGVECENLANYVLGVCSKNKKAIMGEKIDYRTRGSFFVETAATPPFAKG